MTMQIVHCLIYTAVALWLLTDGGNRACRHLFALTGMSDAISGADKSAQPAGRTIGSLERLILFVAVTVQSWEILAAVIALKTVARFKELDDQLPAEYFLVGSLFSVLWAMVTTYIWLGYDSLYGSDLHRMIAQQLSR